MHWVVFCAKRQEEISGFAESSDIERWGSDTIFSFYFGRADRFEMSNRLLITRGNKNIKKRSLSKHVKRFTRPQRWVTSFGATKKKFKTKFSFQKNVCFEVWKRLELKWKNALDAQRSLKNFLRFFWFWDWFKFKKFQVQEVSRIVSN